MVGGEMAAARATQDRWGHSLESTLVHPRPLNFIVLRMFDVESA